VNYQYDPFGRRIAATSGGVTTSFLYDGQDVVQDQGSDGSSTSYINGATIDEKLEQNGSSGPLYFTQDRLGSTTTLTDATGNVAETESYGAFGGTIGSAFTRYGFTGRELDSQTGLMFYRARWYDPSQGRFVTEDPSGYQSGLNLYSYVGNNPLGWIDPTGLGPDSPWWDPGDWLAGPTATKVLGIAGTISSGFADTITGGLTAKIRNATGAGSAIDPCSGWYTAGQAAGYVWIAADVAVGAVGAARALGSAAYSYRLARLAKEADDLQATASSIHSVLDSIAQEMRTTAALSTEEGTEIVGSSGLTNLEPGQAELAQALNIVVAEATGEHAEITVLNEAFQAGELPQALGVSRIICPDCQAVIEAIGGVLTSRTTVIWP
jgi:RHS repeat-associated protein